MARVHAAGRERRLAGEQVAAQIAQLPERARWRGWGGSAGQAGLAGTREGGRQEPGAGPGARALARTRRRAAGPRGKEEGEREIGGGVERISALADK